MLKTRVIPCLLLRNHGLVKTIRFKNPTYVGDPINAVKIFNEKEVDELVFLDITATPQNKKPPFTVIEHIASECFMPLAYGGGVRSVADVKRILSLGVEKVVVNSYAAENPKFVTEVASVFGSQSLVISIDVKKNLFGKYQVVTHSAKTNISKDPVSYAQEMVQNGAGEILINSVDRDGTMQGYDTQLIKLVSDSVDVPVIACGGAGKPEHFADAVKHGGASATAAGSMFVFHGKHRAVLINFPTQAKLEEILGKKNFETKV